MTETNAVQEQQPIVLEIQHTDENGQPLIDPRTGKPVFTNLTGKNHEELLDKLKNSYVNVTRAYNREKRLKAVPKQAEPPAQVLTPEQEAARKMAGTDELEKKLNEQQAAKDRMDANAAAYAFLSAHLNDYYPCKANSDLLSKYISDNELDPRVVDNYEIAFSAVQDKLAQRPAPPAPITPTPEPEPEPAPAPRKQAAGGIQPGSLSGSRPIQRKKDDVTDEKMKRWRTTDEGRAEYKRLMKQPGFPEKVDAFFASRAR